jgi:hypothetical protein
MHNQQFLIPQPGIVTLGLKVTERDHAGDDGVEGRIILKLGSQNGLWRCELVTVVMWATQRFLVSFSL